MHLPSYRYHPTEAPKVIHTEQEHDEHAAAGWAETPAAFDDDDAYDIALEDVNPEAAVEPMAKRARSRK